MAFALKMFFCKHSMSNYFSELRLLVIKVNKTLVCQNKACCDTLLELVCGQ